MTDFLAQLIGTALAASAGGVAAWVAIRVDVALAKASAERAEASCTVLHGRLSRHVEDFHSIKH